MNGLSGQHPLSDLLECAGLARSSYYYALAHPARPTRPELRGAVAEVFSRTANGCGHRQVAMCLRAELGARVADKTVLCAVWLRDDDNVCLAYGSFAVEDGIFNIGGTIGE